MWNMSTTSEKTTIYLNPMVKKFLQHKAVEEETSISELINERVEEEMAGKKLQALLKKRSTEPKMSFEDMLKELGLSYEDLRS